VKNRSRASPKPEFCDVPAAADARADVRAVFWGQVIFGGVRRLSQRNRVIGSPHRVPRNFNASGATTAMITTESLKEHYSRGIDMFKQREPELIAHRLAERASKATAKAILLEHAELVERETRQLFAEYAMIQGLLPDELAWRWTTASEEELKDLQEYQLGRRAENIGMSKEKFFSLNGLTRNKLGYDFRMM
jgi:Family of unknown function (DUF6388)